MSFFALPFALAGLAVALGPVLIHLLNRRRFRVVEWAAMDFLRQALQRNRKLLRLRDLLLLILRTLILLLFGLSMARPYFSSGSASFDPDQPLHAVVVFDNSLSLGYQSLEGSLLDRSRERVATFLERLPAGSRISLIPLCGPVPGLPVDAFRSTADAIEALEAIPRTDRSGRISRALDLAREACQREPDLPAKRVILVGDQQRRGWDAGDLDAALEGLPGVQVVQVKPARARNSWISRFELVDSLADTLHPAVFLVEVRHRGPEPRRGLEVSLLLDGVQVASQVVDLEPGQARQVEFEYVLDRPVGEGGVEHVLATVSLPADDLPADDARHLAVPVVSGLPVVFIDSRGEDESPGRGQHGETYHLRRLLVPVVDREEGARGPVRIRHRHPGSLTREDLEDARLVVVAGVADPAGIADWLGEYVEQGGPLVIAAGGAFDPSAWNATAHRGGLGILPLPLGETFIGAVPGETPRDPEPFQLDPDSLTHSCFRLATSGREELVDLVRAPFFFKAVEVLEDARTLEEIEKTLHGRREALATGEIATAPETARWLRWTPVNELSADEIEVARLLPRVRARFDDGRPFLVERRLGEGRSHFIATGVHSRWNTLTRTHAVLFLDRLLRGLILDTFPGQTFDEVRETRLPVRLSERGARFVLAGPSWPEEELAVEAFGGGRFGVTLRHLQHAGPYRITVHAAEETLLEPATDSSDLDSGSSRLREIPLAFNPPAEESELDYLEAGDLEHERLAWVAPGERIRLEGAGIHGERLWKLGMSLVLLLLLVEGVVLGLSRRRPAQGGAS